MQELDAARKFVQYAKTHDIYVAGRPVFPSYSTSQTITRIGFETAEPTKILIINVYNVQYPINVVRLGLFTHASQ